VYVEGSSALALTASTFMLTAVRACAMLLADA
jgi:hypothetical protein